MSSRQIRGPCNNCGIEFSREWRKGPENNPSLCNACGMRWSKYKDLRGYMPKYGFAHGYEPEVDSNIPGKERSIRKTKRNSCGLNAAASNAGQEISASENENSEEDPGRVNSELDPIGNLNRQLKDLLQKPEFCHLKKEEDLLITLQDSQMASGETGYGCVLLKPPVSPKK